MTLVLAITTAATAFHVSDRQVTSFYANGASKVHSPVENKSLIFICKDAVGTIGYTGAAYIGKQPTDQWLANVLAPQPPGIPPLGDFVFGGGGMGAIRLQTLIWRLRTALAAAQLPLRARVLEVSLSGFRIRRHRSIPFQLELAWNRKGPRIGGLMRRPRALGERILVSEIGDVFPQGQVVEHIKAGASGSPEPEPLLAGLMHAVRLRSTQTKTVGADLMTIVTPNPLRSREILWSFEPANAHMAYVVGGKETIAFPAVYSPWILTPSSVHCPSVGTGGMETHAAGWTIRCINQATAATFPSGRVLFATSHQRRAPPP